MSILGAIGGLAGSIFGSNSAEKIAEQNIKLQKQFAQEGVQWKVADALKAGVHPLAALGAQTHSFSPISVGDPASTFSNVGQNLGRAIDATADQNTRTAGYDTQLRSLQLERGRLENDILKADLASKTALITQAGRSPGIPTSMSANPALVGHAELPQVPGTVVDGPLNRVAPDSHSPHLDPGSITDLGHSRTADGYFPVYGKDIKERLEEDTLGEMQWAFRNRILPFFNDNYARPPSNVPLRPGHVWRYNPFTGEYTQQRPRYYR